ncbi:MAG: hypothetical protein IJS08_09635, partial [Victivallales bacterium]|nr:hypothetical protein [Victivallales bacterium]
AISILREAYEFSLRAKSHHCGVIAQNTTMRKKLGISNDEAVTVLINALSVIESARYRDIKTMLNALYELLPDCSVAEAEQLAALKKLNRRFSKELLGGNKEQWEPIIARLRTVIAAY